MSTLTPPSPASSLPLILIVDDEVDITDTYSMLFELHGFRVATANNGTEALQQFSEDTPDIVLSDCMMPGMDGVELCKRIRTLERRHTPVILTSGAPQLHQLSAAGHDLFLKKPVMFQALLEEVMRLLPTPPAEV